MIVAFILIAIFLFIFFIIFLFYPFFNRLYKKRFHKKLVNRTLYKIALDNDNFLINNVEINFNNEKISFDHIFFGKKYIYCVKDIAYTLGIEGKREDIKWFEYDKKGEFSHIENPLRTNYFQVEFLKAYLHVAKEQNFFFSIVVINDDCEFKVSNQTDGEILLKRKDLKKFLKEKETDETIATINQDQLEKIVQNLHLHLEKAKEENSVNQ